MNMVVVLSGGGSNFQAIADEAASGALAAQISAVFSDNPSAFGLERARQMHIDAVAVPLADYPSRNAFDDALAENIDRYSPDLVVLAGFMRRLGKAFVRHYWGRLLNIHPSLLPAFRGLDTYRRVLEAGDAWHGTSVHFVTEDLDGGPLVAQARVAVLPGDDADSLAARVQQCEYRLYPEVIRWFVSGRLVLKDDRAWMDGQPLDRPLVPFETSSTG